MDVDEIKALYSMRDIIAMYGIQINRSGFISCPFHAGDRTPSMKIYPKDYHCHACGANGDIFSFVQGVEHCTFKDAFRKLGGTYSEKTDYQRQLFQHRLRKNREKEKREKQIVKMKKHQLAEDIRLQRVFMKSFPVFSDDWCDAVNRFEMDMVKLENLTLRGSENDY